LILLLGADAFAGLPGWHRWRELLDIAHVGVLSRAGWEDEWPAELAREVASRRVDEPCRLHALPGGRIALLHVTPLEISATRIRKLLAAGREPRYLLPAGLFEDASLLEPYRTRGET
jgi:nicotinate-nucleotide adenylyltransferase